MTPVVNVNALALKLFIKYQLYVARTLAFVVYMIVLILDLSAAEGLTSLWWVSVIALVTALGGPYYLIVRATQQAFQEIPGEQAPERLKRLLRLPSLMEFQVLGLAALGAFAYAGISSVWFKKGFWGVPWSVTVFTALVALTMIQVRIAWEKLLLPHAIAEFHKRPDVAPFDTGILWPRQRWYLPYAFGLFVLCTLLTIGTIIGMKGYVAYHTMLEQAGGAVNGDAFRAILSNGVIQLFDLTKGASGPLILVGTFLILNAALSAWGLAMRQSEGARGVQDAMEALASGNPKLPDWVSTDEIGDLAVATAKTFEQLKQFSLSLGESALTLRHSAEQLGMSTTKQSEVLSLQATALQETQVTAQEIKQTSALASQKAETILQQTERADEISRSGENAIQQSLNGLLEIGVQVREMANRIRDLDERTKQIANITSTVKDLADQSNMLALNAAIEAVRSGEHGKAFAVVAREIRALADQSIQATGRVRGMLEDISGAIRNTVAITEKGSERVEVSLVQVREFGTNIRALSGIVRDNASSVRQITVAVNQQNAGITEIVRAVNDLSRVMDQAMSQLRASDDAVSLVHTVAEKVTGFIGNYGWKGIQDAPSDAGAPPKRDDSGSAAA